MWRSLLRACSEMFRNLQKCSEMFSSASAPRKRQNEPNRVLLQWKSRLSWGLRPATHERHDLHLVPRIQRLIVLVRSHQPAVQLDGDLFGDEVELLDELAEGRAVAD